MFYCPTQHGLQQAARVISGTFKQGFGESLEPEELLMELHSEMCLRSGMYESGATVERKEGKQLQPRGAALLVVVDDGQNSDAMPEDAPHYQGQSLSIIQ